MRNFDLKKLMTLSTAILFVLPLTNLWASDVDRCDDYLARHYKKDLTPVHIQFRNGTRFGDIYLPHQVISLFVKNVGQVDCLYKPEEECYVSHGRSKFRGKYVEHAFKTAKENHLTTTGRSGA